MLHHTGSMVDMFHLLDRFWGWHCGHMKAEEYWFNEGGGRVHGVTTDLSDVYDSMNTLKPAIDRLRHRLYRLGLHADDPLLRHRPHPRP